MAETVKDFQSEGDEDTAEGKRQRSTIAFPYSDFGSALEVAQAIHSNVGHGTCSAISQLAPWMAQSGKSSGFRTQLAAARLFGLIDSNDTESYRLTELGKRVVDPAQAKAAKAESFIRVPLFRALFDKYKGGVIPPAAALEREIASLGVAEKQKGRARQVFETSAKQTGYKDQGLDKLVAPAVVVHDQQTPPPKVDEPSNGGKGDSNGGGDASLDLDPLLLALLQKIPKKGEQWPGDKRVRWFRTFAMNVSQVYDEDDSPVELSITKSDSPASKQSHESNP